MMQLMHYPPDLRRFHSRPTDMARPFSACAMGQLPRGFSPFRPSDLDIKTVPIRVELAGGRGLAAPPRPSSYVRLHDNRFFRENVAAYHHPRSDYSKQLGMRCESMDYPPRYAAVQREMPIPRHFSAIMKQPSGNPEYYGHVPIPLGRHSRPPISNVFKPAPAPQPSYKVLQERQIQPKKPQNLEASIIDKLYEKSNSKPSGIKQKLDVKLTQSIIEGPGFRRK